MKIRCLLLGLLLAGCASSTANKGAGATATAGAKASAQAEAKSDAKAAVEKASEGSTSVTCESAKETRVLINKAVGKGCEVTYDRNGDKSIAGGAKNDLTYCAKIVEKIQGNLEKAGFKCKK